MSLKEELKELRRQKGLFLKKKKNLEKQYIERKISKAKFKKQRKQNSTEWIARKQEYYQKLAVEKKVA